MAKKTEYELLINIGAEVNKSVEASIGNVTGLLKKAFGAKIIWDGVTALGSKVVEIGAESVQMYSELETSVVRAANVFGGTREEVEAVEKQIESLAITTSKEMPYAASEVSDSLYYLGQVGLTFEESADVMDDMLKLAYADGQDVATVVDLVTDSMSNLQMEINKSNVNEYMNQIAEVMASTNTSAMGALETIMGFGGTSNLLGSNIQEVSALLGVLANVGIKGTEAGTALNSMMTRMVGGTAKEAYDKLGVSLYDDAGAFRGYAEVLKDVNEQISKLTDQKRDPIMKTMFGVHYMNEGQALLNSMKEAEDGSSEYSKILERQYEVSDRLEQMYQNQTDTLGAQTKIFQNNLDASKLILGDAIAPALTEVLNWANRTLFPELENGANALGQYIETNITPNIGGWLDTAYEKVVDIGTAANEFLQSEKWESIKNNLGEAGENLVDALADVNWDSAADAGKTFVEGGLSLIEGGTQLMAGITEFAANPIVQLLANGFGLASDAVGALTGNYSGKSNSSWAQGVVDDFNAWYDPLREKSLTAVQGITDDIESFWRNALGLPANEAQSELDELNNYVEVTNDLIDQTKGAMSTADDPKQIEVYKQAINKWQNDLDQAYSTIRQIKSAMGSGGQTSSGGKSGGFSGSKMLPFADGGIVTRPTIGLIGEAGEKEAVIPLSKLGNVVGQLTGGNITYTQVVHINGNANPDEVKQAMSQSYAEFKANWQRLQKEQRRAAF